MNFFILLVAAYAGAAKYQASGQIVHKLYNVEFDFEVGNLKSTQNW